MVAPAEATAALLRVQAEVRHQGEEAAAVLVAVMFQLDTVLQAVLVLIILLTALPAADREGIFLITVKFQADAMDMLEKMLR